MSFRIRFGRCDSTKNKIVKDIHWPDGGNRTGELRGECEITDPVILVPAGAGAFTGLNYFYIEEFGRFYFITKIRSVRTGMVEVSGHVDVLTSYATYIVNQSAIFSNLQSGYNKMINDQSFKVYQDRFVINDFPFPQSFNTFEYVLAMAGS